MILLLVYAFPVDIGYKNYLFFLQVADAFNGNLTAFFSGLLEIVDVSVSLRRINKFLLSREIDSNNIKRIRDSTSKVAIEVQNGDFKWRFNENEENLGLDAPSRKRLDTMAIRDLRQDSLLTGTASIYSESTLGGDDEYDDDDNNELNQFYMRGVNLQIKKGEKVMVYGKSCSERSSLLYSVMGEMIPMSEETRVIVNGSVSHLAQTRWLLGMSIKDNVVLGKDFTQHRMDEALRCSQLVKDMDTFQDGLETLLGDNGDTISGGQRADRAC